MSNTTSSLTITTELNELNNIQLVFTTHIYSDFEEKKKIEKDNKKKEKSDK